MCVVKWVELLVYIRSFYWNFTLNNERKSSIETTQWCSLFKLNFYYLILNGRKGITDKYKKNVKKTWKLKNSSQMHCHCMLYCRLKSSMCWNTLMQFHKFDFNEMTLSTLFEKIFDNIELLGTIEIVWIVINDREIQYDGVENVVGNECQGRILTIPWDIQEFFDKFLELNLIKWARSCVWQNAKFIKF